MTAAIAIPVSPVRPAIPSAGGGESPAPERMPTLTAGENLAVRVVGADQDGKVLLLIKNRILTAETPFPLPIGENLTVQVEAIQPQILLKVNASGDGELLKAAEFLRHFRSNPAALKELILLAPALLSGEPLAELEHFFSRMEIQQLANRLSRLAVSGEQITEPSFIKDYLADLGLADEPSLLKALAQPGSAPETDNPSLKRILQGLSLEADRLLSPASDPGRESSPVLRSFAEFAASALKTIESLQIVNVMAQERDGLLTIPLPMQFADGIRMQEIYIESDAQGKARFGRPQSRIVLFLDMDALGELAVDAAIQAGAFHGAIRCAQLDVLTFLEGLLPELQNALTAGGYEAVTLHALLDEDIAGWKADYLRQHSTFSRNTVNISV